MAGNGASNHDSRIFRISLILPFLLITLPVAMCQAWSSKPKKQTNHLPARVFTVNGGAWGEHYSCPDRVSLLNSLKMIEEMQI